MDWPCPWKIKALQSCWGCSSPMRARTATGVPGDTWPWVLLCVGGVAVVVASTAVAEGGFKGRCFTKRILQKTDCA